MPQTERKLYEYITWKLSAVSILEVVVAKGQKRSTREVKKPKATKTAVVSPSSLVTSRMAKPSPTKGASK